MEIVENEGERLIDLLDRRYHQVNPSLRPHGIPPLQRRLQIPSEIGELRPGGGQPIAEEGGDIAVTLVQGVPANGSGPGLDEALQKRGLSVSGRGGNYCDP